MTKILLLITLRCFIIVFCVTQFFADARLLGLLDAYGNPISQLPTSFSSNAPEGGTLTELCLHQLNQQGKELTELSVFYLGQFISCINQKYANITDLLEKQIARCDSYQLLLGIRDEFENQLMNTLYPEAFPATKDQYLKCVFVLVSQTGPMVEEYRCIVKESGLTLNEFCLLGDKEVCSPKSKIIHKIQIPDHCLTIDSYKFIVRHDEELRKYINEGYMLEEVISTILKLRQARLRKKPPLGISKFPQTTGKCILLLNVPFVKDTRHDIAKTTLYPQSTTTAVTLNVPHTQQKNQKNRYMPVKQIREIFKAKEAKECIQTICETKESNDERKVLGKVLVEFFEPRHAALGMMEHQNAVKAYDITMEFVRCEDFKCADEDIVKYIY